MKFNERELGAFAGAEETIVGSKGYLWKKGEKARDGYRQRWFVLKGNLLFYFKSHHNLAEPLGCVVLERVSVALTDGENVPYGFKLEFDAPGSRTYYLGAQSDETRQKWMEELKVASYEHVRSVLLSLRERLTELTGRDPLKALHGIVMPDVPSLEAESKSIKFARQSLKTTSRAAAQHRSSDKRKGTSRHNSLSVTEEEPAAPEAKDVAVTMELDVNIGCSGLAEVEPGMAVFVVVYEQRGEAAELVENTKTEAIEGAGASDPDFLTTAHVLVPSSASVTLRFKVFKTASQGPEGAEPGAEAAALHEEQGVDPEDDDDRDYELPDAIEEEEAFLIGEAVCPAADLIEHHDLRVDIKVSLDHGARIMGQLLLESLHIQETALEPVQDDTNAMFVKEEQSTSASRKPFPPDTKLVKRSYRFPTIGSEKVKVAEAMSESAFLFCIPEQLLKLFLDQDKRGISELDELGVLYGPVETVRRALLTKRLDRLQAYTQHVSLLDAYQGASFKKSTMKKKREVEMMTTNLHIQKLRVNRESYYTVTMGAPAAHCMKFSHGGLRRLLDAQSRSTDPANSGQVIVKAITELARLRRGLESCHGKLTAELDKDVLDFDRVDDIVTQLDASVQALKKFFSSSLLDSTLSRASAARPPRSTVRGTGYEFGPKDLISAIEQSFAALQEALRVAMTSEEARRSITAEILLNIQETSHDLQVTVASMCLEAQECLEIVRLQSQVVLQDSQDLVYRRDVCFSQALTSLVTIFTTELYHRMRDPAYLEQMVEVGFLVHYESLLSTSGDETGMIEDMAVAVRDLAKVTIAFEAADEVQPPRLSGERYHICVTLFMKPVVMKELPIALRGRERVRIVPIMFSQGVNEKQTLANKLGDTELQERINKENLTVLQGYINAYKDFLSKKCAEAGVLNMIHNVDMTLAKFKAALQSKKQKNLEILMVGHDIVRIVNGGRLTCCKSGKDRTSMSVTLEQCEILVNKHSLVPSIRQQALDAMRSVGTRRENVAKNTGVARYAFNKLQVACLPKLLKPPLGTFGTNIT